MVLNYIDFDGGGGHNICHDWVYEIGVGWRGIHRIQRSWDTLMWMRRLNCSSMKKS